MKTKEQILSELYVNEDLKKIVFRISGKDKFVSDELHSELFLCLCEKSDEYIISRHQTDTLIPSAIVTASNLVKNKYGDFAKKVLRYRRSKRELTFNEKGEPMSYLENMLDEQLTKSDHLEQLHQALIEELPKLHYYPRSLIKELIAESKQDEGGRWQHVTIKDISQNGTRYRYNAEAIRKGKKELKGLIEKNLYKKECIKIL